LGDKKSSDALHFPHALSALYQQSDDDRRGDAETVRRYVSGTRRTVWHERLSEFDADTEGEDDDSHLVVVRLGGVETDECEDEVRRRVL